MDFTCDVTSLELYITQFASADSHKLSDFLLHSVMLQCPDTVGWLTGRASSL